jgi:hypothetical protein
VAEVQEHLLPLHKEEIKQETASSHFRGSMEMATTAMATVVSAMQSEVQASVQGQQCRATRGRFHPRITLSVLQTSTLHIYMAGLSGPEVAVATLDI